MKCLRLLIVLGLMFISINQVIYSNDKELNDSKNEQALTISSDPVNTFLEIKIKSSLFLQEDSLKSPLRIEVRILNQKGIMVFSATKNISDFDIFTGGLPEGNYTLLCKICNRQLQKEFVIKH